MLLSEVSKTNTDRRESSFTVCWIKDRFTRIDSTQKDLKADPAPTKEYVYRLGSEVHFLTWNVLGPIVPNQCPFRDVEIDFGQIRINFARIPIGLSILFSCRSAFRFPSPPGDDEKPSFQLFPKNSSHSP